VVVLKGHVADDKTKQRIEEVAKAVPGVTWVQSQLAVIPRAG
jgi:osmotically-inducible protein OsmY